MTSEIVEVERIRPMRYVALVFLLIAVLLSGCCSLARGWPGPAVGIAEEGTLVFVGSRDGNVYGLDTEDGDPIWLWKPEVELSANPLVACGSAGGVGAGKLYSVPAIRDDTMYLGAYDGRVHAVDLDSRDEIWRYKTDGPIAGNVAVTEETVFVGSSDRMLYALERFPSSGSGEGDEDVPEPGLQWDQPFEADEKIWATPVVADGKVLFGSLGGMFYAVNAGTGESAWEEPFNAKGGIVSEALVVGGKVYFGSFDGDFYALDADTGELLWDSPFQAEGWFWANPVYHNGVVFACCLDHSVYALDGSTGDLVWSFDGGSAMKSSPVAIDGTLIAASEGGMVYGLDMETGDSLWDFEISDKLLAPLAVSEGRIYIYANDNSLHCVDAETQQELWVEQMPAG